MSPSPRPQVDHPLQVVDAGADGVGQRDVRLPVAHLDLAGRAAADRDPADHPLGAGIEERLHHRPPDQPAGLGVEQGVRALVRALDAPVLADADIGIAVGSATDLARETASLVLPTGGLWMLPWIITVARRVRSTILTNLAWAFGYNLIALTLAALGLLQPVLAAAIMASSSLLLVVNSLRLSRLPDPIPGAILEPPPSAEPDSVRRGLGVAVMAGPAIERG